MVTSLERADERMGPVLELSRKLALLGYEIDLWTGGGGDPSEIETLHERIRVIRQPPCAGRTAHVFAADWSAAVLRFMQAHGLAYTFIGSHSWDAGLAAQPLAAALGVPHVHTPHTLDHDEDRSEPGGHAAATERARHAEQKRQFYPACDLVIATTPSQLDALVRDYGVPAANVRMLPQGYDDHRFFPVSDAARAALRRRLGFKGKVLLATGRPVRRQGHDLLIDAFSILATREPQAVLHLAIAAAEGSDDERRCLAELTERARRSPHGNRIVLGPLVPEAQLPDYYRAADLFVLSSRYEPFGLSAIQAMASGTPTVVTVHGGLYRVLAFGRHALFADPFDCEDLGITMTKVFRHPRLRIRLARMGAHKVRSLFTWTGIAHQLVALVERRMTVTASLDDSEA